MVTGVSEQPTGPIFRDQVVHEFLLDVRWILFQRLYPWRCNRQVIPKRGKLTTNQNCVTSLKTEDLKPHVFRLQLFNVKYFRSRIARKLLSKVAIGLKIWYKYSKTEKWGCELLGQKPSNGPFWIIKLTFKFHKSGEIDWASENLITPSEEWWSQHQ